MELTEVLKMPKGFTPPDITVKIEKVYERKSGETDRGPWSFQDIQVIGGGRLKLKGLPEFPKTREGMTVTLKANQSDQHGLTGMKVDHEEYQGKTYDKLVITGSCKWEWHEPSKNGSSPAPTTARSTTQAAPRPADSVNEYVDHLMSCAALTNQITTVLGIADAAAMQACFATLCIDTKNRGVLLPKALPNLVVEPPQAASDPFADAPLPSEPDEDDWTGQF